MDGEYTYKPIHHTFLERKMFTMSEYYKIHNNRVGFPESSLLPFLGIHYKLKMIE